LLDLTKDLINVAAVNNFGIDVGDINTIDIGSCTTRADRPDLDIGAQLGY
jgi:hypothetical protein